MSVNSYMAVKRKEYEVITRPLVQKVDTNRYWFVGCTRSCQEKMVEKALSARGIENYLPVQKVTRQWSDRKVVKDRIVIPGIIFFRCTENDRRAALAGIEYLTCCMADKIVHKPMHVPDAQMETFRRVVCGASSEVRFLNTEEFASGDMVRVIRGPLSGVECEIASVRNKTVLCVKIGILGAAIVDIEVSDIEKVC